MPTDYVFQALLPTDFQVDSTSRQRDGGREEEEGFSSPWALPTHPSPTTVCSFKAPVLTRSVITIPVLVLLVLGLVTTSHFDSF